MRSRRCPTPRQGRSNRYSTATERHVSERSYSRCRPTSSTCSRCATAPDSTMKRSALSSAGIRVRSASGCTACSSAYDGGTQMTRHDRSNLSELEQDLADLAQPSPREDRFLRELRAGLAERVSPVERQRRRRPRFALRRKPAAVAVAALAVATAAALALVGTRETGGPGTAARSEE